mgnify:CR=1 FL=1
MLFLQEYNKEMKILKNNLLLKKKEYVDEMKINNKSEINISNMRNLILHQIDILLHQIMVVLANLHKRQMPAAARLMVIGDWKILTQQEINNRARQSWV